MKRYPECAGKRIIFPVFHVRPIEELVKWDGCGNPPPVYLSQDSYEVDNEGLLVIESCDVPVTRPVRINHIEDSDTQRGRR